MTSIELSQVNVKFPLGGIPLKRRILNLLSRGASGKSVESFHALKDISLSLVKGDRLGLIGGNGAGKTTLLRTLAGVYEPFSGNITTIGSVTSLISVTAGLEMHLTGRQNIRIKGLYMGLAEPVIQSVEAEVVEFADIGAFIDLPLKKYSSGMLVRLAFAISTSFPVEILLLDEWLSAGDKDFADKSELRMKEVVGGASIMVLASHSMSHIETWCNKAVIVRNGEISPVYGDVSEAVQDYQSS